MTSRRLRPWLLALWLVVVAGGVGVFVFQRDLVAHEIARATSVSLLAGGIVYLALGSVRGFTLIPSTTLVVAAIAFLPPVPLFLLTLVGILISSASIYWFAGAIGLGEVLERRHPARIARLKAVLQRHELPIIIGWSFFPLAPTDLICYVCGLLRVDFVKCLIGVGIGEGTICGIYIFLGDQALRWLHLRG
jgi:uncharacterized membrane protein YdjX (TVP38/TMEM64 family)